MIGIFKQVMGGGDPNWLFLSFDVDQRRITAARRVMNNDSRWGDWNNFVDEQVRRAFQDPTHIPNERVYAYRFPKSKKIPLLNGEDNNHYIDFVNQTDPVYQLSVLEGKYALDRNIKPTELRQDESLYDGYAEYVQGIERNAYMAMFKHTVETDPTNYTLLYQLLLPYLEDDQYIHEVIDFLNQDPNGLSLFGVLERAFRGSSYVRNGWDIDDYEQMILTPVEERTGLHYLKAELDKVDIQDGRIYADHPDRQRMIMELTLYARKFNIPKEWYLHGAEREWYRACLYFLTDADRIAREINNFAYDPNMTRTQLQYLISNGTSAQTLVMSGVMGDVIMSTPFFSRQYGMDMSMINGRKIDELDEIIVEATRLVLEKSIDFLNDVIEKEEDAEQKEGLRQRLDYITEQLASVTDFQEAYTDKLRVQTVEQAESQFTQTLDRVVDYFLTHPYAENNTPNNGVSELFSLIASSAGDFELAGWECEEIVRSFERIPYELLQKIATQFLGMPYARLPEHGSLTTAAILKAGGELKTPLQRLVVASDVRKLMSETSSLEEYLKEKRETERRIQKEINTLVRQLEDAQESMRKMSRLICP